MTTAEDPNANPIVKELVATATLPYRTLLPEEVLDKRSSVCRVSSEARSKTSKTPASCSAAVHQRERLAACAMLGQNR